MTSEVRSEASEAPRGGESCDRVTGRFWECEGCFKRAGLLSGAAAI